MNPMIPGAAAVLAGASVVTVSRNRSNLNTIETFISSMRPLTVAGNTALDEVCRGKDPNIDPTPMRLSKTDLRTIFWNSRLNVCVANCMRLAEPENLEWAVILRSMLTAHSKTRWLILLSAIELIVGRLGLGQITIYPRLLLWTYGEELELLELISEKCSPLEGNAIRAIL
jgi:hypothetical protein